MKKKILCERKNGSLMTIETTKRTLDFMYESNMIVRAWYTDGDQRDVMGSDVW